MQQKTNKTKQNKTKPNKTEQNQTKQNKIKQNKTKQNKQTTNGKGVSSMQLKVKMVKHAFHKNQMILTPVSKQVFSTTFFIVANHLNHF